MKDQISQFNEYPSTLEGRLNALINSINTEPKQITLLLLREYPQTGNELCKSFKKTTKNVWPLNRRNFHDYCGLSFVMYGLAKEELISIKQNLKSRAWSSTNANEKFGKNAALFALQLGAKYNISLFEIFKSSNSPSAKQAPYTRYLTLEYLLKSGGARRIDLSEYSSSSTVNILDHLRELERIGLVNYTSMGTEGEKCTQYSWIGGDPKDVKPVSRQKNITSDVVKYLTEVGVAHRNEISKFLSTLDYYKNRDFDKLNHNVSIILGGIASQGFAKSSHIYNEQKSFAKLTDMGKLITTDLQYLRNLADNNDISIIKFNLEDYASEAVLRYKNVYSFGKSKDFLERCQVIYELIDKNKKINKRDIRLNIGVNIGIHLNYLLKENKITKERIGRNVYYSIKN